MHDFALSTRNNYSSIDILPQEWEDQLSQEREKTESVKRKFNKLKLQSTSPQRKPHDLDFGATIDSRLSTPNRSHAESSHHTSGHDSARSSPYRFSGFAGSDIDSKQNNKMSSGSSVVSMGSEFAQRAKSMVQLMNCQTGARGSDIAHVSSMEQGEPRL